MTKGPHVGILVEVDLEVDIVIGTAIGGIEQGILKTVRLIVDVA